MPTVQMHVFHYSMDPGKLDCVIKYESIAGARYDVAAS